MDSGASETQARVKITPRERDEARRWERKSRARVSLALLSLRKNGTTRSLHRLLHLYDLSCPSC